jgi:3-methyladenine DNA glycosylase AlkD
MGRGALLRRRKHTFGRSAREGGWSLVELTVTLFLLMAIALFGMKTMVAGFLLQNWSIAQSMTDAYAGIETAYAQRKVFADITSDVRWNQYPHYVTTQVTIGQTPFQPVAATITRTYHPATDPVTGAVTYLLESYVVYTNGQRNYCKVSKVYRSE